MKKNVTMITLLLLIAGILSGCGNKPNEDLQNESVQTAEPAVEPGTENPSAELETEETQPKFDVAQDVLLSYEYDSNGELSKVIFMNDIFYPTEGIYEFAEFETTYDVSGRLESIQTNSISRGATSGGHRFCDLSIKSDYNADGQIIFLTVTALGGTDKYIYNYEVVYNSPDDCITVYIYNPKDSYISSVNQTRTYDSNCNLISFERFQTVSTGELQRIYEEYVNGILSHAYYYDDSTGRLLYEYIYHDNGNMSEKYIYDKETGELENHYRYDRNGDRIN